MIRDSERSRLHSPLKHPPMNFIGTSHPDCTDADRLCPSNIVVIGSVKQMCLLYLALSPKVRLVSNYFGPPNHVVSTLDFHVHCRRRSLSSSGVSFQFHLLYSLCKRSSCCPECSTICNSSRSRSRFQPFKIQNEQLCYRKSLKFCLAGAQVESQMPSRSRKSCCSCKARFSQNSHGCFTFSPAWDFLDGVCTPLQPNSDSIRQTWSREVICAVVSGLLPSHGL